VIDTPEYWRCVEQRARALDTDGCSGLLQAYQHYCWEHDIHYRTHETLFREPIGKWKADAIFAWRHLRHGSPAAAAVGAGRWLGLTVGGWFAWYGEGRGSPVACAETP
jgi:hypothetical protein